MNILDLLIRLGLAHEAKAMNLSFMKIADNHYSLRFVGLILVTFSIGMASFSESNRSASAQPQLKSDQTLDNPTKINLEKRRSKSQFMITGGTQKGRNLFHSFQSFSLSKNQDAVFQNISPRVNYVISRVTGKSSSFINGGIRLHLTQGTLSPANFIFLNPQGIRFGSNASLNLSGSFIASTAKSIKFKDDKIFGSDISPGKTLLSIAQPSSFQTGQLPQPIELVGANPNVVINNNFRVNPRQSLILIGGDIKLQDYGVVLTDGRIELVSLAANQDVQLQPQGIPRLQYANSHKFSNIELVRNSLITVTTFEPSIKDKGIYLAGNEIALGGGSEFQSFGSAPISIQSNSLKILADSKVSSFNRSSRVSAPISIQTKKLLVDHALIQSQSAGDAAAAGEIQVESTSLTLLRGGQLFSRSQDSGVPGPIQVMSKTLSIDGGFVNQQMEWRPSGILTENSSQSPLRATPNFPITVSTRALSLSRGGQISTTTFNTNNAGNVDISAQNIDISGNAMNPDGTLFLESRTLQDFPTSSGLFTSVNPGATGDGGALRVKTARLQVRKGGKIQAATFGIGDAGFINIQADVISVTGQDREKLFPSTIFAGSGGIPGIVGGVRDATGSGNDINLTTQTLLVNDNAAIAVGRINPSDQDSKRAGDLNIAAETAVLSNGGSLVSNTASGDGGRISLTGYRNADRMRGLFLLNSGQISSTAGLEQAGGNGGDIDIDSETILANVDTRLNAQGSDITANAFNGTGGNIDINANLLLGLQPRPARFGNQTNDIDASSALGTPGTIDISANLVDPTQALVDLPVTTTIPTVAQRCDRQIASAPSSLIDSGKGGLAKTPQSPTHINQTWEDLRPVYAGQRRSDVAISKTNPNRSTPHPLIEAQGLVRSPSGQVLLVAEVPNVQRGVHNAGRSCLSSRS